jgi:tetratricopeptide (TPR) repeat protein
LLTKGNIDEAVGHFHKALQIEPDLASARENLKKALKNRSEKYNKIIDSIKKELESDPENYRLFFKLGNAYKNMGNIDDAEKSYKQALLIQPEYIPAINNLGLVHIQRKEDDKALFLFKKIIEIQPDSVMAYYNLACISSKQNNIEAAVQWLQKAVENGFNHWNSLKTDNDLKNIRSTSYYQKLESEH